MAKLDLEWLAVFEAVYKSGNVSRAAERLGLVQGTASMALGKLRKHFGDALFTRTSRGMEPTAFAQSIYPEISEALARLAAVHQTKLAFDPGTDARVFRLGMTDVSEATLLPTLMTHLRQVAPFVRIEVEGISALTPQRLESGDIDLAIGFMPNLEAGFYQQLLFDETVACMVANTHPRIGALLTVQAFFTEGHAAISEYGTGHAAVKKAVEATGKIRDIVITLPSFLGIARLVAQTDLLALLPRHLGEMFVNQEAVRLLPPPFEVPSYAIKQHWHARFHAEPGNIWLRRTIAGLFHRPGAKAARAAKAPF